MKRFHLMSVIGMLTATTALAGGPGLKVNCLDSKNDKNDACQRPSWVKAKSYGNGPGVKDLSDFGATYLGGFAEGNTLFVGVANRPSGAVLSVDLTTGDRKLVSGKMVSPADGTITVGTGPDFSHPYDIARGPDGNLYTWGSDNVSHQALLHRVDPKTGNRTVIWDGSSKTSPKCSANGPGNGGMPVGSSFAVGPGGAFYVSIQNLPIGVGYAIMKIGADGKTCEPVSMWKNATDPKKNVGSGPEPEEALRGLRFVDGALFAIGGGTAVYKIDIASGQRKRISSSTSPALGSGADKVGAMWSAWDPKSKLLWTGGSFGSSDTRIISVDPATGNRAVVDVKGGVGKGKQGNGGVWVHPTLPLLITSVDAYGIVLVDPTNGNSNILSQ